MKAFLLLFTLFTVNLYAQQPTFTKIVALDKQSIPSQVIELSNKNYLCVISSYFDTLVRNKSKLIVFSPRGLALDSIIFSAPDKDLNVFKVVETSYGVCLMGVMKKDTNTSLWVVNLNKQWQIINEQTKPLLKGEIFDINFALDKDSTIVLMPKYKWASDALTSFVKINKKGEIIVVKSIVGSAGKGFPNGIVVRQDNEKYNLIYYDGYWVCDTSFANWRFYNIQIPFDIDFRFPYISETLIKNDSTFLFAGDIIKSRTSISTNAFFTVIKNYQYTNFKETVIGGDTCFATASKRAIDMTKDGRFIYIGGNYNYQESIFFSPNSFLRLTKMDNNYNTVWTKDYGGDANYRMTGVIATSDGGCIIYAMRFNHNSFQQIDVIVIKVDGNGLVTSTNSIPNVESSIVAYPNPSNGQLHFKKEDPSVSRTFELNIFDISGKLVFQKKETDLSETYDINHLATGDYMYQIKQKEQIISIGKWVKIE
jgi:hypothetical protein